MERDMGNFGKVVQMGQMPNIGLRVSSELRAYWEGLRKGRLVPSRAEVDPRGIERALEYAFIIERVAPGMGRFRLAGMHLNDLMGMEVRGMPMTAMFSPAARTRIAEVTEAMFADPSVVELVLRAESGIGKPPLMARLLLLPLTSDLGDVNRALGCLVAEGGDIGRTPRRFELVSAEVQPIAAGTSVPHEMPAPVQADLLFPAPLKARGERPVAPVAPATPAAGPKITGATSPEERRAMFRLVRADD